MKRAAQARLVTWHPSVVPRPPGNRIVIANRAYRSGAIVALLLLAGVIIGASYDPVNVSRSGSPAAGLILAGLCVAAAARTSVVGLVVRDGKVFRRTWLRTRSYPGSSIQTVDAVNYSGLWNWASRSMLFSMIRLTYNGKEVDVPEIVGRPIKIRRLADELTDALGLRPSASRDEPRHRRD